MKRIYVCSRLRGADGQPAQGNIERARKLMRAVFDAGHAPFAPHLLYPQVLTESPEDLQVSFRANYAFLDTCDEIWIDAKTIDECSRGMKQEIEYVVRRNHDRALADLRVGPITITRFMPPEFVTVPRA